MSEPSLITRSVAARVIATCTTPRCAAVLAALPPRPGVWMDESELLVTCGLAVDAASGALARLLADGVVERVDGRVRLARAELAALGESLVTDSPVIALCAAHPRLTAFTQAGRITGWPTRPDLQEELVEAIGDLFPSGYAATEAELGAYLGAFVDDTARVRRALVDAGALDRDPGSARYARP